MLNKEDGYIYMIMLKKKSKMWYRFKNLRVFLKFSTGIFSATKAIDQDFKGFVNRYEHREWSWLFIKRYMIFHVANVKTNHCWKKTA